MTFVFSGSLLRYVNYQRQVSYDAVNVADALQELFGDHAGLQGLMLNADGSLRRTLRLAINNQVVPSDLAHPLSPSDSVEVMTAVSGG
jgi:molybdopterin synthase sulfur carrier subunit